MFFLGPDPVGGLYSLDQDAINLRVTQAKEVSSKSGCDEAIQRRTGLEPPLSRGGIVIVSYIPRNMLRDPEPPERGVA